MKYNKLFITNLPSFYKLNLYNAIAERKKIYVVFTGDTAGDRNKDFFKGDMKFDRFTFRRTNLLYRILTSLRLLLTVRYDELVVGGWDSLPMWIFALLSPAGKNSVVVESSYLESQTDGLKGRIKRFFIRRIRRKAYVSGIGQQRLVENLKFRGTVVKTKGVGVFNVVKQPPFEPRAEVRRFLYVGRLTEVKNLPFLVKAFRKRPDLTLTIAGFGEQEQYLKSIAGENVQFLGAVDNKKLSEVYQANDVFVLPSISEPWGLVVEEALNNGMPVLVSDRVGCGPEIVNENNGRVFRFDSEDNLLAKIDEMTDAELHNRMRLNISRMDFEATEHEQIEAYLS